MAGFAPRKPKQKQTPQTTAFVASPRIQPKLEIGAANDHFEQEADRVADEVMSSPDAAVGASVTGTAPTVQRACDKCSKEDEKIRGKAEAGGLAASAAVSGQLAKARGAGASLPDATRAFFEPRYGRDLSNVRVHTDERAQGMAKELRAKAFTVGDDIFFNAGRYAPNSSGGRRLLAHELTHVIQQSGGKPRIQREPDATLAKEAKTPEQQLSENAATLEAEIFADPVYKKLPRESRAEVKQIIRVAKTKPVGNAQGERNYYLSKLKLAITTPFDGKDTGKVEYACSPEAEKRNRAGVQKALADEKFWWNGLFADVEETAVATATKKTKRKGQDGKTYWVDRSDPKNIRVKMKVKLNGPKKDVDSIKQLEDAIERESHTTGYYLDIEFVEKSGSDVFEFSVDFCLWANSGNWAAGPKTLSHEVHHALGLDDRYDYIESHATNRQMNVAMRVHWFAEQMKKTGGARDPYSKMHTNSKPLLAEDVCTVAFEAGAKRTKCIDARKDLDDPSVPPP
jgi:hypothetical protein